MIGEDRARGGTRIVGRVVVTAASTPDLTDVVVRMEGVAVRRGPTTLLRDVDWTVELDERWVVLGPNGAGKTTLLRLAAGRAAPDRGHGATCSASGSAG